MAIIMAILVMNGTILTTVSNAYQEYGTRWYINYLGEVSGYTETKLEAILEQIEACADTTSLCSISVLDLTAVKDYAALYSKSLQIECTKYMKVGLYQMWRWK